MKLDIVRIGNSRGIRLPKAVLDHYGFTDSLELSLEPDGVLLKPSLPARSGWEAAFAAHPGEAIDPPLLPDGVSAAADEDWTW